MLLLKSFFIFFSSFIYFLFLNFGGSELFNFSFSYINLFPLVMHDINFSFILDDESKIFLFMVTLVTSLVSLYSCVYMEGYNNKKFFYLMTLFFLSMMVLSLSSSSMSLMMGWDSLGISSICLIMFYPNQLSFFNSYMTFFFNRLGDCFLIWAFVLLIEYYSSMFFFCSSLSLMMGLMILICSFTKSAQFPVSSWLPAAMSAPTPISAMVHSSTLVTAGIFLMWKTMGLIFFSSLCNFLLLVSSLTFLVGGFLSLMELDLKKIVAFSTMSQISMVIFFMSMSFISLAVSHMIYHAMFKTLLFCCCGIIFLSVGSDQMKKSAVWSKDNIMIFSLFLFSVFSMSGLIFSSSFYSKDLVLESLISQSSFIIFLSLIIGSFFTLMYSSKIFSSLCKFSDKTSNYMYMKFFNFKFLILFSICTLSLSYLVSNVLFESNKISLEGNFTMVLFITISSFLILSFNLSKNYFNFLPFDIMFSKMLTFSIFGNVIKKDSLSLTFSDQFIFKTSILKNFNLNMAFKSTFFIILAMFSIIVLFNNL